MIVDTYTYFEYQRTCLQRFYSEVETKNCMQTNTKIDVLRDYSNTASLSWGHHTQLLSKEDFYMLRIRTSSVNDVIKANVPFSKKRLSIMVKGACSVLQM